MFLFKKENFFYLLLILSLLLLGLFIFILIYSSTPYLSLYDNQYKLQLSKIEKLYYSNLYEIEKSISPLILNNKLVNIITTNKNTLQKEKEIFNYFKKNTKQNHYLKSIKLYSEKVKTGFYIKNKQLFFMLDTGLYRKKSYILCEIDQAFLIESILDQFLFQYTIQIINGHIIINTNPQKKFSDGFLAHCIQKIESLPTLQYSNNTQKSHIKSKNLNIVSLKNPTLNKHIAIIYKNTFLNIPTISIVILCFFILQSILLIAVLWYQILFQKSDNKSTSTNNFYLKKITSNGLEDTQVNDNQKKLFQYPEIKNLVKDINAESQEETTNINQENLLQKKNIYESINSSLLSFKNNGLDQDDLSLQKIISYLKESNLQQILGGALIKIIQKPDHTKPYLIVSEYKNIPKQFISWTCAFLSYTNKINTLLKENPIFLTNTQSINTFKKNYSHQENLFNDVLFYPLSYPLKNIFYVIMLATK